MLDIPAFFFCFREGGRAEAPRRLLDARTACEGARRCRALSGGGVLRAVSRAQHVPVFPRSVLRVGAVPSQW